MKAITKRKKYLIITSSDAKYGDFLVSHWSSSLLDNVNMSEIDVVVLNYGLTNLQKKILLEKGIKVVDCLPDGNIVNIRYRDMLSFLRKNKYHQILSCDGGDIIFQRDISFIFKIDRDKFRVVFENMESNFLDYLMELKPFRDDVSDDIGRLLKGKKIVNGGLIVAPYAKFIKLCSNINILIKNKSVYGPDQVVLNYTVYKSKFSSLDPDLNYVINNNDGLRVVGGEFYHESGEKVSVVHNAGGTAFLRSIDNFGYGKDYNKFNSIKYNLIRAFIKSGLFVIPKYVARIKNALSKAFMRGS